MSATLVLLGCGDLGTALALRLQAAGTAVLAVRRRVERLPSGLPGLGLDYADPAQLTPLADPAVNRVLFTPTPAGRDPAGYERGYLRPVENLLNCWSGGPARQVLFVSSTRVYGCDRGEWVDESTDAVPADEQGRIILEAEQRLLASPHRVTVVRFAGIYGRLPSAVLQRVARGELCPPVPVLYSNRIHRDDCIGFLEHLLTKLALPESLYLGVDDLPSPRFEVERWLAERMGVTPAQEPVERRGGQPRGKRCRNEGLSRSGYQLLFPDYRSGYTEVLARLARAPG